MSQSYEILRIDSDLFPILIIGKNYHSIDDYMAELELELRKLNYEGRVMFDFLLSNGYKSSNRFMCSLFNGNMFNELHNYQIDKRNKKIIAKLTTYYFNNEYLLLKGILSKKDISSIISTRCII